MEVLQDEKEETFEKLQSLENSLNRNEQYTRDQEVNSKGTT